MTPEAACHRFGVTGEFLGAERVGEGKINGTWFVTFRRGDGAETYVVQRLNPSVFHEPERVMHNIALVTEHLRHAALAEGEDPERQVLRFLTGADGKNFFLENGVLWRCYPKIRNSVAGGCEGGTSQLEETGSAFGRFQRRLLGLDPALLYETIPGFHDTPARFARLFRDAETDPLRRADEARPLLETLAEHRELAETLCRQAKAGQLPLRVTHNDTKCSNVLFDRDTRKALAVIDLDTVMPGLMAYDFGDTVRSAAIEESLNEWTELSVCRFGDLARGFLRELGAVITPEELDSLPLGAVCVTLELAARYLDDYLTGDHYFGAQVPGQNLARARRLLGLALDMKRKLDRLWAIVELAAKSGDMDRASSGKD